MGLEEQLTDAMIQGKSNSRNAKDKGHRGRRRHFFRISSNFSTLPTLPWLKLMRMEPVNLPSTNSTIASMRHFSLFSCSNLRFPRNWISRRDVLGSIQIDPLEIEDKATLAGGA
jgi:hypothetical protein